MALNTVLVHIFSNGRAHGFPKSGGVVSNGWKHGRVLNNGMAFTEKVDSSDYRFTGLHPVF